jgi:hypothetical protein
MIEDMFVGFLGEERNIYGDAILELLEIKEPVKVIM